MRINADKPRGNSDYYFQHITMREESRKGETDEGWKDRSKAKHKESHMEHITTSTVGFLKIWDTKKGVGEGWRISRCFSDATATKFPKFCKLGCRFQILMGVILQYITLTSTDLVRSHQNVIMMLTAKVTVRKVTILHCGEDTHRFLLLQPNALVPLPNQLILTQLVPALPHLTFLLKTDQQYNLITAALQRETSVNTSPFYLLIHLDK